MGSASLGLKAAGYEIAAAVDIDPWASKNYELNLGISPIVRDLRKVTAKEILDICGVQKGDIDLVLGCPPCQGFSTLRNTTRKKNQKDFRNTLPGVFADRITEMAPRAIIFENVSGILRPNFRKHLDMFTKRLTDLGYLLRTEIIDGANFGIPQFRRRVIAVGIKVDDMNMEKERIFPEPTHAHLSDAEQKLPAWKTVRSAIGMLPPLKAGERSPSIPNHEAPACPPRILEMIRKVPKDGGSRRSLPRRLWLGCHKRLENRGASGAGSVYGRMWWDRPAPTITTRCTSPSSGRFLHPEQDRPMTIREAMLLQTIPISANLVGPRARLAEQVGNAAPARLIELFGRKLSPLLTL